MCPLFRDWSLVDNIYRGLVFVSIQPVFVFWLGHSMEAEDWISEVEDRMVEIKETGKNKKELKEMRTTSETSGTM